jgi:O-antigen biosynthesis protein WbqP
MRNPSKRLFDFLLSLHLIIIFSWLFILIILFLRFKSSEPIFYLSNRVGVDGKIFKMPKFRTMNLETPTVASHLLLDASKYLTPTGLFLRKSSLDELPQLWSILIGDMSFVGPRPALFNQDDLISHRKRCGIDKLTPGLTGWAQVNGRDELSIPLKLQYEIEYLSRQSFWFDIRILFLTFFKVVCRTGISH